MLLGPECTRMRAPWAAASGPLATSPSSSSFGLAWSSAWLPRRVLWGFGWGEHVCTHAPLTAGAHRLSQAFPALHLSGSTWCGINLVDCCPGEVRGGGKGHSLQRPLFALPPVRGSGPAQLSHTPPGRAQNSLITQPLPLCPQGRDAHSASGFGFYSVRIAGTSNTCPQNQPPPSLPLLIASFLVPALARTPHPHPNHSLCNLCHRSRWSSSLLLSFPSCLHVCLLLGVRGPKTRPSTPSDLLCNLHQVPETCWTLILTGTKWSYSRII